jgi:hypothetical protein
MRDHHPARRRRSIRRPLLATVVAGALSFVAACDDDAPASPDTPATSQVRAPNGTNMGAPPINAGTSP